MFDVGVVTGTGGILDWKLLGTLGFVNVFEAGFELGTLERWNTCVFNMFCVLVIICICVLCYNFQDTNLITE